jgi:diguanylate cyclase (GGDEF)-like protein
MCRHQVQFYDSEAFLLSKVCAFIDRALQGDASAVVIATASHLQELLALLDGNGMDQQAVADRLVCLDAHDTLTRLMVDGLPDEQRFIAAVGGLLERLSDGGRRPVHVCGEMGALLYAEGNVEGAVRLERLCEGLFEHRTSSVLCAYPMSAFPDEGHRAAFHAICTAHARIEPLETVAGAAADPDWPHGTIARLQQAANSLEREIARRRELEKARAELEHLAGHDPLTGLGNRRIFTDRLEHACAKARRAASHLALVYIDLDAFKPVNDRFGHEAGDELLVEVATRLTHCVRGSDTVCRLGGDEFSVVMEDADAGQAAVLAQRIVNALAGEFVLNGQALDITASIGISLHPDDGSDVQTLLRSADSAMYRAKQLGQASHGADGRASVVAWASSAPADGHPS